MRYSNHHHAVAKAQIAHAALFPGGMGNGGFYRKGAKLKMMPAPRRRCASSTPSTHQRGRMSYMSMQGSPASRAEGAANGIAISSTRPSGYSSHLKRPESKPLIKSRWCATLHRLFSCRETGVLCLWASIYRLYAAVRPNESPARPLAATAAAIASRIFFAKCHGSA